MPFSAVTPDVLYVLRFVLSPPALLCVLAAGAATLVAQILLHFVLVRPIGAAAEMAAAGGPFRAVSSPAMLYPPLLAPAVQAALSLSLATACFGAPAVRAWPLAAALRWSVALWACSAAHGILLDWAVFRMSWRVPLAWWAGSLAGALVAGACIAELL